MVQSPAWATCATSIEVMLVVMRFKIHVEVGSNGDSIIHFPVIVETVTILHQSWLKREATKKQNNNLKKILAFCV